MDLRKNQNINPLTLGTETRNPKTLNNNHQHKGESRMKRFAIMTLAIVVALFASSNAMAAGTAAGSVITNTATATFTVGTETIEVKDSHDFPVAEIISFTLANMDTSAVQGQVGQSGLATKFVLTNTGNGTDIYNLAMDSTILGAHAFLPDAVSILIDDGDNIYNGADLAYNPGVNDVVLDGNGTTYPVSRTIFLINDMPMLDDAGDPLTNGDTGDTLLTATSRQGTVSGTQFLPGANYSGTNTEDVPGIIAPTGIPKSDVGVYVIVTVNITIVKSSTVISDTINGANPSAIAIPGAVVRYNIQVSYTGSGTATDVKITDPIPANTVYKPGSIILDTISQSDTAGNDACDFNITNIGEITALLGSKTAPTAINNISFEVIIQ